MIGVVTGTTEAAWAKPAPPPPPTPLDGALARLFAPQPPNPQPPTSPPAPAATAAPIATPLAFEQRLAGLHYDVGPADGIWDEATSHAVMAFQKVHDMARTGQVDDQVIAAVGSSPAAPTPLVANGEPSRVEIDLRRQVLFLYENGALASILPVSTGNGETFCSEGWCRAAETPTGSFNVYRQGSGWETGPLGSLYNPQYFQGGVAIHGSESVPAEPASHGCVRIPMGSAEWFPSHVTIGTPVHVV